MSLINMTRSERDPDMLREVEESLEKLGLETDVWRLVTDYNKIGQDAVPGKYVYATDTPAVEDGEDIVSAVHEVIHGTTARKNHGEPGPEFYELMDELQESAYELRELIGDTSISRALLKDTRVVEMEDAEIAALNRLYTEKVEKLMDIANEEKAQWSQEIYSEDSDTSVLAGSTILHTVGEEGEDRSIFDEELVEAARKIQETGQYLISSVNHELERHEEEIRAYLKPLHDRREKVSATETGREQEVIPWYSTLLYTGVLDDEKEMEPEHYYNRIEYCESYSSNYLIRKLEELEKEHQELLENGHTVREAAHRIMTGQTEATSEMDYVLEPIN